MKIEIFDTVVLQKNIPEYGIKSGDIGAVIEMYEPDGVEVEFVTGSGKTIAVVTLFVGDVRLLSENDILAVRKLDAA